MQDRTNLEDKNKGEFDGQNVPIDGRVAVGVSSGRGLSEVLVSVTHYPNLNRTLRSHTTFFKSTKI